MTHAGIRWTLEVNRDWCIASQEMCKLVDDVYVKTGGMKIGAVPDGVDIVVDVDTVSGVHAEFEEDSTTGDLYVTDLGR